jgi:hypothetical protein|tara:strand:- start:260 stop:475 length:216 start_codon:yes stop_codon:yes gene_type:complete
MKLFEFYEAPAEGYQDQEADNSVPELGELRKTKLTLKQISKLRKMYDLRNFEKQTDLKKVQAQFAPPPAPM